MPAVSHVESSSKKGESEDFCLLAARDQRALLYYNEFLRPKSEHDLFFVDFHGKPLTNVSRYIRAGAAAGGIKDLTTNLLRSCAETANAAYSSRLSIQSEEEQVAARLGHTIPIRNLHYIIPNEQNLIATTSRLLFVFEEEGERKTQTATTPAIYDPVSVRP